MRQRLILAGMATALLVAPAWERGWAAGKGKGLEAVMIDSVEFREADLATALSYLAAKAEESAPALAPVNFLVVDPGGAIAKRTVTLKLSRVPWSQALKYTCTLAEVTWRAEGAVILVGEKKAVDRLALQRSKIEASPGSERTLDRLGSTLIDSVRFDNASLAEVTDYLRQIARARDQAAALSSPGGSPPPLNFLIKENAAAAVATRKITLNLRRISVGDLLHYATGLAGCRFRVDARAVVIGESADLARPPGGPRRPGGPIHAKLAGKTIDSIDIPAGTGVAEFLEVVRALGGVNGIAMSGDAVAASRLALHGVSALEMLRYFNEVSGTAYRLDPSAFVITDDAAVKQKPRPPGEVASGPASAAGKPADSGFDP